MKKILAALLFGPALAFAQSTGIDTITWPSNSLTHIVTTTSNTPCFNSYPTGIESLIDGTQRAESVFPCEVNNGTFSLETFTTGANYSITVTHAVHGVPTKLSSTPISNPASPSIPATRDVWQWSGPDDGGAVRVVTWVFDYFKGPTSCGGGRGAGCHTPIYMLDSGYITLQ